MKGRAFLALRGPAPNDRLVSRLLTRKNLASGCITSRPCFCSCSAPLAKKLRPPHSVCPCVSARGKPVGGSFLATPLKTLAPPSKLYFPIYGWIMPTHTRLTVSVEDPHPRADRKWPRWPDLASAGGWRSLVFPGCVDWADDVARDMSKLHAEKDTLPDDETEEKVHRQAKGDRGRTAPPDGR